MIEIGDVISVLLHAVRPNLVTVCDVLWHPAGVRAFVYYSSSQSTLCSVHSRSLWPVTAYSLSFTSTFTAHIFCHSGMSRLAF